MSRLTLFTFLAVLVSMLAVTGCSKSSSNDDAAKVDPAAVKQAADENNNFFAGLDKAAKEAGDDCDKLGKSLNDYLAANKDAYIKSTKTLADGDDSADVAQADSIMNDDSDFRKAVDKCADNAAVKAFNVAFVDVMIQVND